MRLLKTSDYEFAQKLCALDFRYTKENVNRVVYYCFPAEEIERSPDLLSQFSAESFFIGNTLSF